jgi:hypothetical protein
VTDITKDIIHPMLRVLEGNNPCDTMAALAAVTACVVHQVMMPAVAEKANFDAAMAIFARQVQENLVMLIEENKA